MLVRTGILALLAALLIYGSIKAYPLLSGPEILLSSPADGTSTPDGFIVVSGIARHTETLTLDGGPFLIDEQGRFSRELLLPHGTSILSLTATDRFGRSVRAQRTVFVP